MTGKPRPESNAPDFAEVARRSAEAGIADEFNRAYEGTGRESKRRETAARSRKPSDPAVPQK